MQLRLELAKRDAALQEQLQRIAPEMSPSLSAADRGKDALKRLRDAKTIFPIAVGSGAVLQHPLGSMQEHSLVAALMPALRQVFGDSGRVVANGEFVAWPELRGVSARKPDINVALVQFLQQKPMWESKDSKVRSAHLQDGDLVCGVPGSASVSGDAARGIECKSKIGSPSSGNAGNTGLGELLSYEQARLVAMRQAQVVPPACIRSMLAGSEYFWLLTMDSKTSAFVRLDFGQWETLGSVEAIQQHFTLLPWESAVLGVFGELSSQSAHFKQFDPFVDTGGVDRAWLGEGGMGRVFRAWQGNDLVAVKVVLQKHAVQLEKEFQYLARVVADHKDLPIIKPCSKLASGDYGAGYALQSVGKMVRGMNLTEKLGRWPSLVHAAFAALWQFHTAGVVHGDARLANLILIDKKHVLWTDLAAGYAGNDAKLGISGDLVTLAKSCFPQVKADVLCKMQTADAKSDNCYHIVATLLVATAAAPSTTTTTTITL